MKKYELRVFFESGRKSFNSGQVYCISGLRDMVLDLGTVPKNSGRLESLSPTEIKQNKIKQNKKDTFLS